MTETPYISAKDAALRIGKTPRRVNQLVIEGELRAVLIGNSNAIEVRSIEKYLAKSSSKRKETK